MFNGRLCVISDSTADSGSTADLTYARLKGRSLGDLVALLNAELIAPPSSRTVAVLKSVCQVFNEVEDEHFEEDPDIVAPELLRVLYAFAVDRSRDQNSREAALEILSSMCHSGALLSFLVQTLIHSFSSKRRGHLTLGHSVESYRAHGSERRSSGYLCPLRPCHHLPPRSLRHATHLRMILILCQMRSAGNLPRTARWRPSWKLFGVSCSRTSLQACRQRTSFARCFACWM